MTLEQLKVLQKIVELGTLKAAALALYKTQPALSMSIKKLEQEYGVQLLDRRSYRLTLTPQGKTFYRQAQVLLLGADQLDSLGKLLSQGDEAVFKIGYDPLCDNRFIINILNTFQSKFPTTSFELIAGSRFSSLEQLNNNEVDVAIGAWFHLFHGEGDYLTLPIDDFELVLAAAPDFLANHAIDNLYDLNQLPSVTLVKSGLSFDNDRIGTHSAKPLIKTKDIHTLKAMLIGGLGTGMIPKVQIEEELLDGRLEIIELSDFEHSLKGEVRAIIKVDKVLGPVGTNFWDYLKQRQ